MHWWMLRLCALDGLPIQDVRILLGHWHSQINEHFWDRGKGMHPCLIPWSEVHRCPQAVNFRFARRGTGCHRRLDRYTNLSLSGDSHDEI